MCMVDDAEGVDFSRSECRQSRKQRRCGECGREIAKGERYWTGALKSDGYVFSWQCCLQCRAATSWLSETCRGWLLESVLEDLLEHWREDEPGHRSIWLARAIVGMRRKWRTRRGALMKPLPAYVPKEAA